MIFDKLLKLGKNKVDKGNQDKNISHAEIVKNVLDHTQLAQVELARFLQVHPSTVSHWLAGTRSVKPKYWRLLIRLNDEYTVEDFIGDKND